MTSIFSADDRNRSFTTATLGSFDAYGALRYSHTAGWYATLDGKAVYPSEVGISGRWADAKAELTDKLAELKRPGPDNVRTYWPVMYLRPEDKWENEPGYQESIYPYTF